MICGVDEAGRGPVMGPLVVCGIAVESEDPLMALGVRDSKRLSPARREALAPRIIEVSSVEVLEVPAEQVDDFRGSMTMNELEAMLFARIVDKLSPDTAYLDAADASEGRFDEMVRSCLSCRASTVSRHRADEEYAVVSAASIVAKVARDRRMSLIEEELGGQVGSGYTSDPVTRAFLERWVGERGDLPPHTRRSWKTSQRLMTVNGIQRLDAYEG